MLQFEGYTLDIVRNSLRAADREIALRRKCFELLRYLVENPDRLVTKEELIKAIWPGVVVTDESVAHCVSEVRQAIGDSKQPPSRPCRAEATASRRRCYASRRAPPRRRPHLLRARAYRPL